MSDTSPMSQDRTIRYLTGTLDYTLAEAVNAVNGAMATETSTYQLARHQVRWDYPGVYIVTEAPDHAHTRHLGHTHLGNGPVPGCPGCRPGPGTLRPTPESGAALDPDLAWLLHAIPVVDQHLDDAAPAHYRGNPLANRWRRVTKVCEESGEVWDALSRLTGENPRKGTSPADLLGELGDTAFCALLAIQSQTKDIAATWAVFTEAAAKAYGRVPDAERPS